MKIHTEAFRIGAGEDVDLKKRATRIDPIATSTAHYQTLLADQVAALSKLQERLYAANNQALLVIFQAMDAAGKDGAIAHVMSGVNPQGCQVFSFKHPSEVELGHDFLWRTTRDLPERGRIGIFNRSYYEEVLIARVHPEILKAEGLPKNDSNSNNIWDERYHSIRGLERHLSANGTVILKFFLHLSKDEQRKRFLDRIDDPNKNWKFSPADLKERQYWKQYRSAYEHCLRATSTADSPWYAVPADDKQTTRLIVSQIIVDTLDALDLSFPKVTKTRRAELLAIREKLAKN